MSEQISFESYQGISVLFVDCSGLSEDKMIDTLNKAAKIGFEKSELRILVDFSRTRHIKLFNQKIKQHASIIRKKEKVPK